MPWVVGGCRGHRDQVGFRDRTQVSLSYCPAALSPPPPSEMIFQGPLVHGAALGVGQFVLRLAAAGLRGLHCPTQRRCQPPCLLLLVPVGEAADSHVGAG